MYYFPSTKNEFLADYIHHVQLKSQKAVDWIDRRDWSIKLCDRIRRLNYGCNKRTAVEYVHLSLRIFHIIRAKNEKRIRKTEKIKLHTSVRYRNTRGRF